MIIKPSLPSVDLDISPSQETSSSTPILLKPPPLPSYYTPLPDVLQPLAEYILSPAKSSPRIISVIGSGGLGKTVSISAFCLTYKDEIQKKFPDGIYWLTVGNEPNIISLQSELYGVLHRCLNENREKKKKSDTENNINNDDNDGNELSDPLIILDEKQGNACITNCLSNLCCLVVLDDIWESTIAECFITVPEFCLKGSSIIITSRIPKLLIHFNDEMMTQQMRKEEDEERVEEEDQKEKEKVEEINVKEKEKEKNMIFFSDYVLGSLTIESGYRMLGYDNNDNNDNQNKKENDCIQNIIEKICQNLPLAVSLLAGIRVYHTDLSFLSMEKSLMTIISQKERENRKGKTQNSVFNVLSYVIDFLSLEYKSMYIDLAVFNEDTWIPIKTLKIYYFMENSDTDGSNSIIKFVKELSCRNLIRIRGGKENIEDTNHESYYDSVEIMLHDICFEFIKKTANLKQLHQRLLRNYASLISRTKIIGASATTDNDNDNDNNNLQDDFDNIEWHLVPDDGYFYKYILLHFKELGRYKIIGKLLKNFYWIDSKLQNTFDIINILTDYSRFNIDINKENKADEVINKIVDAIMLSAHVLAKDSKQLAFQINARLDNSFNFSKDARNSLYRGTSSFSQGGKLSLISNSNILFKSGGSLIRVLDAHTEWVRTLIVFKSFLISGSNDMTVKVWSIHDGKLIYNLLGHFNSVIALTIDEEDFLISGAEDNTIRRWCLKTGKSSQKCLVLGIPRDGIGAIPEDMIRSIASIPSAKKGEGNHIAIAFGKKIIAVDMEKYNNNNQQPYKKIERNEIIKIVKYIKLFGKDPFLCSGDEAGEIVLWNLEDWTINQIFSTHTDEIRGIAFSSKTNDIISGGFDTSINFWKLVTKNSSNNTTSESINRKKKKRAGDSKKVTPINLDKNNYSKPLYETNPKIISGHEDWIFGIDISKDSEILVSGGDDDHIRIWEFNKQGKLLKKTKLPTFSGCFDCKLVNKEIAVSASEDIRFWHVERSLKSSESLEVTMGHTEIVSGIAIDGSGLIAVTVSHDKNIIVWEISQDNSPAGHLFKSAIPGNENGDEVPRCVALSFDGHIIIVGTDEGNVIIWSLIDKKMEIKFKQNLFEDVCLSISTRKDGLQAAACSDGGVLVVFSTETGDVLYKLVDSKLPTQDIVISEDGRILLCGYFHSKAILHDFLEDIHVEIFHEEMGKVLKVAMTSDKSVCTFVTNKGQLFVYKISRIDDNSIVSSTTNNTRYLASLIWLQPRISWWVTRGFSLVLSPCGRVAITSTWDRKIQIWDIENKRLSQELRLDISPVVMNVSSNWKKLGIGSQDGSVHFLEISSNL